MNLETRLRSGGMRLFSSHRYLSYLQSKGRIKRKLTGASPVVYYFHNVEDPYSHLAVQKMDVLKANYRIEFQAHLVSEPDFEFQGDPLRFHDWALRDASHIAEHYGVTLSAAPGRPNATQVAIANNILSEANQAEFAETAVKVGTKLWLRETMEERQGNGGTALESGNRLRRKLGHYFGAMFYFEGEWFWGLDRVRSLEKRLIDEGYSLNSTICVPEPAARKVGAHDTSTITLEYFPSLRSPYTAVGHPAVLDLVKRTGVNLIVRPVMPMMMRGIPAPREKQRYIITDAAREARERGVPFGHMVDPFGDPVMRAFALFPATVKLNKGLEFVTAYLSAAWAEGVDITTESGLRQVASAAGIDWDELKEAKQGTDWQSDLDENLAAMNEAGLWGVPSFRITGGNNTEAFSCWGQDRVWRVESEINMRATPDN
jgi:2-hydroxychromene-2-carboxylate isomerase